MLKSGLSGSTRVRLRSAPTGSFFFQPLDLHVEPSDLLVELGLDGQALVPLAAASVAEERFDTVQELLLPLADLDRVDLEGPRQLGQGPGRLDSLQGDLGLEGGRVALLTCVGHEEPRDATVTFDQINIPSGPVFGVVRRETADSASLSQKGGHSGNCALGHPAYPQPMRPRGTEPAGEAGGGPPAEGTPCKTRAAWSKLDCLKSNPGRGQKHPATTLVNVAAPHGRG